MKRQKKIPFSGDDKVTRGATLSLAVVTPSHRTTEALLGPGNQPMHFFKALTRGGRSCAIVVKVEYLRRVQSNRLESSREGDTNHARDCLFASGPESIRILFRQTETARYHRKG